MGAQEFSVIQTGRTAQDAFTKARDRALYDWGHAGYTGTIAEKDGFKVMGQLSSRYLDYLEVYLDRTEDWYRSTRKNKRRYPKGVPESIAPMLIRAVELYVDKWGPAVCFEITGAKAKEIKEAMGRKGTWDKVFWFGGLASS